VPVDKLIPARLDYIAGPFPFLNPVLPYFNAVLILSRRLKVLVCFITAFGC